MDKIEYSDFFGKFGGSLRSKHVVPDRESFYNFKAWAKRLLSRGPFSPESRVANKRRFNLPETSALPRDYVRLDPWEAEYLFVLAARSRKGIVETGRFHGGSTFLIAYANRAAKIHSIDIAPQNDDLLRQYFSAHGVGQNVNLIVGDSQNAKYPEIGAYDLLFIDGDHSYQGCTSDLENWYPQLSTGGHIVLHDCYYGSASDVQEAVVDFMGRHTVEAVRTPYIQTAHWQHPCGSLAHFIKRD